MKVVCPNQLTKRLAKALGLERCRELTLHSKVGELVTVKALCFINETELEEVVKVFESEALDESQTLNRHESCSQS